MNRALNVYLLPQLAPREALSGAVCVVIDVLRATTTIARALAEGAERVLPALEVDDALRLARSLPPGSFLLGGERGGLRIDGFDLGNSPREYTRQRLAGRTLIFTTTNGTRAMLHCEPARRIVLAGFVNLSAVVKAIAGDAVHIVCAGTRGEVTREDALLAGALVDALVRQQPGRRLNDQAVLARDAWRTVIGDLALDQPVPLSDRVRRTLRDTEGGRNLIALALERDIDDAGEIDAAPLAPELAPPRWEIRVSIA